MWDNFNKAKALKRISSQRGRHLQRAGEAGNR